MQTSESPTPLTTILGITTRIHIVDIGASPSGGHPPYQILLDQNIATVIGFEPNQGALTTLEERKRSKDLYLPYIVADGKPHTFYHTSAHEMSSILEPNMEVLSLFHGYPEFGTVERREPVQTSRLDDIIEIDRMDMLKIDIQGAELLVFQNGLEKLANCQVIHTEVEFLQMYKNQPLFSEVELFLRTQGFVFHRFAPLRSRVLKPLKVNGSVAAGLSQILDADAVFIRDPVKLHQVTSEQLLKLAIVLHDIYGSIDVAFRVLRTLDKRDHKNYASKLAEFLSL